MFWGPGLVAMPRDEWANRQQRIVTDDRWIMDGDLGRFTTPRRCGFVWRTRLFSSPFQSTVCLACPSEIARARWLWLLRYRRRSRPILMEAIARHAAKADLHVLRNPTESRTVSGMHC
jgi:hypothetical protein